jgi:hypothetical protein
MQPSRFTTVFGRCSVQISAGALDNLTGFPWFSSVTTGKFQDTVSLRLRKLASKSFSTNYSKAKCRGDPRKGSEVK